MRLQICALLCMAVAWIGCEDPKPQLFITGMEGKPLPAFTVQLLDSTSYIQSASLTQDKNLVVFYFSPTCPYCRAQMRDMLNNIEKFKDKKLCILTNEDLRSTKAFASYFKLNGLNNVIVGRDTGSVVMRTYGQRAVPFTACFDNNKQLKALYTGRIGSGFLSQL